MGISFSMNIQKMIKIKNDIIKGKKSKKSGVLGKEFEESLLKDNQIDSTSIKN